MFYPEGGMDAMARAMTLFYTSKGGVISYKKKVKRILVKNKRAYGVELEDGSIHTARYIMIPPAYRFSVILISGDVAVVASGGSLQPELIMVVI